jgi:hypothetical protein
MLRVLTTSGQCSSADTPVKFGKAPVLRYDDFSLAEADRLLEIHGRMSYLKSLIRSGWYFAVNDAHHNRDCDYIRSRYPKLD